MPDPRDRIATPILQTRNLRHEKVVSCTTRDPAAKQAHRHELCGSRVCVSGIIHRGQTHHRAYMQALVRASPICPHLYSKGTKRLNTEPNCGEDRARLTCGGSLSKPTPFVPQAAACPAHMHACL